ncbi:hypothetical protein [uncultured Ruminococcus sp.]|uniref:hypothetical protein n=1 Tax=uncultured Ruminococcus sp. TaxID=165186 RepID=UPI002638AB99|nr:hypothetical protein [uncultured Ruminococcus sp.]
MSLKEYVSLLPDLNENTIFASVLIFVLISIFKMFQKTLILDRDKCDRTAEKAMAKFVHLIKVLDDPVINYSEFYDAYLFIDQEERRELKLYIDNHDKKKIGKFFYSKLSDYDLYISKIGDDELLDPLNASKVINKLKIKENILYPLAYTFLTFVAIFFVLCIYAAVSKQDTFGWLKLTNQLCAFIWTLYIFIDLFMDHKLLLSSIIIFLIAIFNVMLIPICYYFYNIGNVLYFISDVLLIITCVKTKSACNLKDITKKMNFKFNTQSKRIINKFVSEQNASLINKKGVRTFAYLYDNKVCAVFQAVKKEENIVMKNVIANEVFEDIKEEKKAIIYKNMMSYFNQ